MTQVNKVSYFKATVQQKRALKIARVNLQEGKFLTLRHLKRKLKIYE